MTKSRLGLSVAVLATLTLIGCGGGSGNSDTSSEVSGAGVDETKICIDTNLNKACDDAEASTVVKDGRYTLDTSSVGDRYRLVAELPDGGLWESGAGMDGEISPLTTMAVTMQDKRPVVAISGNYDLVERYFMVTDVNRAQINEKLGQALKTLQDANNLTTLSEMDRKGALIYLRNYANTHSRLIMENEELNSSLEMDKASKYGAIQSGIIKPAAEVFKKGFSFAGNQHGNGSIWVREFNKVDNEVHGNDDVNMSSLTESGSISDFELTKISTLQYTDEGYIKIGLEGSRMTERTIQHVETINLDGKTMYIKDLFDRSGYDGNETVTFSAADEMYVESHYRPHVPLNETSWSRATNDFNATNLDLFIAEHSDADHTIFTESSSGKSAYFEDNGQMLSDGKVIGKYFKQSIDDAEYLIAEMFYLFYLSHGSMAPVGKAYTVEDGKVKSISYSNFGRLGGCGIEKYNVSAWEKIAQAIDPAHNTIKIK